MNTATMKDKAFTESDDQDEGPMSRKKAKLSKGESPKDRLQYKSNNQSGAHGEEYQNEIALLMLWRATLQKCNFKLAYEMADAGKFDDTVFINEDTQKCLLLQVKHAIIVKPVEYNMLFPRKNERGNGDFDMYKYLKSYWSIQQSSVLPGDKKLFIVTNRPLSDELKKLVELIDTDEALESILNFTNSTETPKRFKPTTEIAEEMVLYVNQEFLKPQRANAGKSTSDTPPLISIENVEDFFGTLTLLFGQPDKLESILRSEFLDWMREWIHPADFGKIDELHLLQCINQLKDCLVNQSCYDKETKSKSYLTLTEGETCVSEIRQKLLGPKGLNKHSTLAKFEDFYINRRVSLTDSNATTGDNHGEMLKREDIGHDFKELLDERCANNEIIVLTAKPGMGKSTLFYHVSQQIQSKNNLVYLIYLNNLIESLKQITRMNSLKTSLDVLGLSELNQKIIHEASQGDDLKGKRIIIFLDAFDEISPLHAEKVIQLIKTLREINCIQIVVSGRRHVENMLKEKLKNVTSLNLIPFSELDQKSFLRKKWKISTENELKFETYSRQILSEFHSSVDRWRDFLGIPLMLKMFADVQYDDFNRFQNSSKTQEIELLSSERTLTMVKLYENFIQNCLRIKFEKTMQKSEGQDVVALEYLIELSFDDFLLTHQMLAVRQLKVEELVNLFDNKSTKTKFYRFMQIVNEGHEKSPLVECVNGKVQFIHQSYAEYMVAKYLFDYFEDNQQIFDPDHVLCEYAVVRKFFLDMIEEQDSNGQGNFKTVNEIFKNRKNLAAVLICMEGCLKIVKYLIEHNPSFATNYYQYSYTFEQPLHFAASSGHENLVRLLIQEGSILNARNSHRDTPLHCAIKHKKVVKLLLESGANVNAQNRTGETPLHKAIKEKQEEVAKILIEHINDESNKAYANSSMGISTNQNKIAHKSHQENKERTRLLDEANVERHKLLINVQDMEGKTPLHYAAEVDQLQIIELFLGKSGDVHLKDFLGRTPLHYAAKAAREQIVELLLGKIEHVDIQDFKGKTPLHFGAKRGQLKIVALLMGKSSNIYLEDYLNRTALEYASEAGHFQVVEFLLNKSVNDDKLRHEEKPLVHRAAHTDHLKTSLHYATEADHQKTVELLLGVPGNKTLQDNKGKTPLHYAAELGEPRVFELLLQKLDDVDLRDFEGKTPLHYAAQSDKSWIVESLMEKSADVKILDFEGKTPLHYAAKSGNTKIVELLLKKMEDFADDQVPQQYTTESNQKQIVGSMFGQSVNGNVQDDLKKTPLHYATEEGQQKIVEWLLEKSVNVNLKDDYGQTPLHRAAQNGYQQICEMLLANSADVNVQDWYGKTPLHYASFEGQQEIVKLLLEKSIDVNLKDKNGQTPLHYAAKKHNQQIFEMLSSFCDGKGAIH